MAGTIPLAGARWKKLRFCLNGVRPRWPEQFIFNRKLGKPANVSMESGLDGRNNEFSQGLRAYRNRSLNGVRPRWPEQFKADELPHKSWYLSQWSPA